MADLILAILVVILPTAFAIAVELVSKDIKDRPYWRVVVLVFGFGTSGLTGYQMWRADDHAARDRQEAILETSAKVSESVTKSVGKTLSEQYADTINELQGKIGSLEAQLRTQGKKVDVIGQSNIVTGKNPIRVEVTNPSTAGGGEPTLNIHASSMVTAPQIQYGQHATQIILTTNIRMHGAHVTFLCKDKLNRGEALISGSNYVEGGGRLDDEHTFQVDIGAPDWAPDFPLVVTFFHDVDLLGTCYIKSR